MFSLYLITVLLFLCGEWTHFFPLKWLTIQRIYQSIYNTTLSVESLTNWCSSTQLIVFEEDYVSQLKFIGVLFILHECIFPYSQKEVKWNECPISNRTFIIYCVFFCALHAYQFSNIHLYWQFLPDRLVVLPESTKKYFQWPEPFCFDQF